jgi:hypothetical protein
MMQRNGVALFTVFLGLLLAPSSQAQQPAGNICADQPLPSPIAVPATVVDLLMRTPEGKDALNEAKKKSKPLEPAKLFRATEVSLRDSREAELVVIGSYPMTGGDNDWFWIVRQRPQPEIILFTGGNCLGILSGKTSGYSDVQSAWYSGAGTLTTVYKFNGRHYRKSKEKFEENKGP